VTALLGVDVKSGEVRRYVSMQDGEVVITHEGKILGCDFRVWALEDFRRTPPIACVLKPPRTIRARDYRPAGGGGVA